MTRAEVLKVINMVFDIGESPEHYIDCDYETRHKDIDLYVFKKDYDGPETAIEDSITISKLDEEAMAWIERWTAALRKERVQV